MKNMESTRCIYGSSSSQLLWWVCGLGSKHEDVIELASRKSTHCVGAKIVDEAQNTSRNIIMLAFTISTGLLLIKLHMEPVGLLFYIRILNKIYGDAHSIYLHIYHYYYSKISFSGRVLMSLDNPKTVSKTLEVKITTWIQ